MLHLILLVGTGFAAPLDQPSPEVVAEARRIVHEMIESTRGPYSRIRWFCNDGTTQPPVAYACREHGGGRQHAEFSQQRQRLAELGWMVGTIYASLTFEELFESAPRQQRLRELALELYLIDIDNGWVLQRALGYRGRVQVEDEESSGRQLLLQVLTDSDWVTDNFLLVREAARVIPHGEETDLARSVRRAAIELAELDSTAEPWRAEIHASPNAGTADRLRQWLRRQQREDVVAHGEELAADLDLLYGAAGRLNRIDQLLARIRAPEVATQWQQAVVAALQESSGERIAGLCSALEQARSAVIDVMPAAGRLDLVDAMQGLETEV